MRKRKYMPYFFNYQYERKTYKYIGKDYGNYITANIGWIRNIARWYRKRIYNRNESKYKFCNTYEEWVSYVKNKLPMRTDYKNYLHWLVENKRFAEGELETVKAILIPIYIALLSVKEILSLENTGAMLVSVMVVTVISAYKLWKDRENLDFWNDLIVIVNSVM